MEVFLQKKRFGHTYPKSRGRDGEFLELASLNLMLSQIHVDGREKSCTAKIRSPKCWVSGINTDVTQHSPKILQGTTTKSSIMLVIHSESL